MDAQAMMDQAEAKARDYWRTIGPDVTVAEAVAMPFSGERNLTLRKALGVKFPSDTVVYMNAGDVIQVVVPKRLRADAVAAILRDELPAWTAMVTRRPDRQWLVTGYRA